MTSEAGRSEHRSALVAWFTETAHLRTFALWNIFFWLANQVIVPVWFFVDRPSFKTYGLLYVSTISVSALWLSALAWWQSTRVEERQIESEDA